MLHMHIQVKADKDHLGTLTLSGKNYPCALGKTGVTDNKVEGDNATPIGSFPIRAVYYRADRLSKPRCSFDPLEITAGQGWCDDPSHAEYNRKVALPFEASHEVLMREDHVYDVVVILGHNDDPPIPGRGSCIFMHVARPDYSGTEGCIALSLQDLLDVLTCVSKNTTIDIISG
jgi:L,D-peptidoglycan transpeptidase YkuD (ErfK/YbiS/YcfS/YnhG family)